MRGSLHVHMMMRVIERANVVLLQQTPEGIIKLASIIDACVHTWTLPVPEGMSFALFVLLLYLLVYYLLGTAATHPSHKICPSEPLSSQASQVQLAKCVSFMQMHTNKCEGSCLKYCKPNEPKKCRYGYPKMLQDTTTITLTPN